jgi:hypothetical protein
VQVETEPKGGYGRIFERATVAAGIVNDFIALRRLKNYPIVSYNGISWPL